MTVAEAKANQDRIVSQGMAVDRQLTLFDIYPELMPVPEMWKCMKTCANCGKHMDWFPIRSQGKRCMYGTHMDGTSGNDMYQRTDANGQVHIFLQIL